MPKNPFESPPSTTTIEMPDTRPISLVTEIAEGTVTIRSREDLAQLVEAPLLEACQHLYDLNIKTLMSSANEKDIENGAYIDIDFDSLSEENKEIALQIGSKGLMHGSNPTPYVKVTFPITISTTVDDIEKASQEVVSRFNRQPLTLGRYTQEELASMYGITAEEITPEEWGEEFPYDSKTGYFYQSEELMRKASGS